MKNISRLVAVLLLVASLFSLAACGESEYEPVLSTGEESKVMITMDAGGERYEIRYELYRALFLNFKSAVDGGDSTLWSGDNKDELIDEINELIIDRAARIYATFAAAEEIGIDPYSSDIESEIRKLIKLSVEGGDYNGELYTGYGTYDDYLAALKKMNMNYSVQKLMYRYMLTNQAIEEYYKGDSGDNFGIGNQGGKLSYTKDDVKAFYDSDDCVRVLRAFLQSKYKTKEDAERIRQLMASKTDELNVASVIINNSLTAPEEVMNGQVIGRYSLDEYYYAEFTKKAFLLDIGEVSEVIEVVNGSNDGYFIIYRAEKSDDHFDDCYADVELAYVDNEIGKKLDGFVSSLKESVSFKELYSDVIHAEISME